MNFKDILITCQAETNFVPRSLGQALCFILCWPCAHFCREIREALSPAHSWVIAMATRGPSPELYSKLLYQEWTADNLRKWKMDIHILTLSFFSSFLAFWYWSSKSGPSLLLLNYSQCLLFLSLMCRLIHECLCLMRWGIGIELAHSSSLGVTPRVTCWQGWQNDGVSLKRPHWGEHISVCWRGSMTLSLYCLEGTIQDRKVVMSGSFWTWSGVNG